MQKNFRIGLLDKQVNPLLDLTMKISHQIWDEWCRAHCLFYILFSYRRLELLKPFIKTKINVVKHPYFQNEI